MERICWRTAVAVLGLVWLGGCSGSGRDVAPPATAAPEVTAASQPGTAAGSVPANASEGQPGAGTGRPRAAPPAPSASAPAEATAELRDDILRLVGNATCRDDSQCRALPLGSKPCGGPEGYIAWSVAATDARQLEALAARYKEARQARNQRLGLMSDCAIVPEPPVRCVRAAGGASAGRCETGPARGGPVPATR